MHAFVQQYVDLFPELCDLYATHAVHTEGSPGNGEAVGVGTVARVYRPHVSNAELVQGIRPGGRYHKGVLQCKRGDNYNDCYVIIFQPVHGSKEPRRVSVNIQNAYNINRALSGDIVAVELLGPEEYAASFALAQGLPLELEGEGEGGVEESQELIPSDTAEASVEEVEGLETAPGTGTGSGTGSAGAELLYGRVVGILRRSSKTYAGSINKHSVRPGSGGLEDGAVEVLFHAVDRRIPPVRISTRRLEDLLSHRILVSIDHWPQDSPHPLGHYVRKLGLDGDKGVETQVLLHEFGIASEDFSEEVMGCLPPASWSIEEELALNHNMYVNSRSGGSLVAADARGGESLRMDLRSLPIVSIDPPGCKDIDDALHCILLPSGNYEVGVHIADVTYFIAPDSPLDLEAAQRSTSTYLVERRLDMLPGLLTTQLCSLRSREDHLAFSVIWEMDARGNILGEVRFTKSVIHSVASLTYDEAQQMLDMEDIQADHPALDLKCGGKNNRVVVSDSVRLLNHLAIALRNRRIEEGALTLASTEVRFKLDEQTQSPTDVTMYALKQANALVEEFMLLANITVSKKVLRHFPTLAVLRRHQPPSREQFLPLVSAARAVGVELDISTSKALADSLDAAQKPHDPYFNKLLRILSTRCMMPAQYFCSGEIPKDQWHHYGLAAPVYTHFTSPIRRYADIIVHRLLAAAIGVIPLPSQNADRAKQQDQCAHMNKKHKAAQYVQRASVNLHTLLFFK